MLSNRFCTKLKYAIFTFVYKDFDNTVIYSGRKLKGTAFTTLDKQHRFIFNKFRIKNNSLIYNYSNQLHNFPEWLIQILPCSSEIECFFISSLSFLSSHLFFASFNISCLSLSFFSASTSETPQPWVHPFFNLTAKNSQHKLTTLRRFRINPKCFIRFLFFFLIFILHFLQLYIYTHIDFTKTNFWSVSFDTYLPSAWLAYPTCHNIGSDCPSTCHLEKLNRAKQQC